MHPRKTCNFDLLAGARVVDDGGALEGALVDAHVGQLAEATFLELERETEKRSLGSRGERDGRSAAEGGQRIISNDARSKTYPEGQSVLCASFFTSAGLGR